MGGMRTLRSTLRWQTFNSKSTPSCGAESVQASIPARTEILMPKKRRGRPRVRDLEKPFAHYADSRASVDLSDVSPGAVSDA